MAELKITTDVFAPEAVKVINITTDHPSKLLSYMPKLLQDIFRLGGSDVFEDQIKWDASETEKIYFWGAWRAKIGKDARSTAWFDIKVQGEQNVKDKFGKATIKITASLTSTWKFSSAIERAWSYFYLNYVYADRRRKYIEEVKRNVGTLENELRRRLGVVERHGT
jgi:hypothetical protein